MISKRNISCWGLSPLVTFCRDQSEINPPSIRLERDYKITKKYLFTLIYPSQSGITCGAIDEPRISSKAIDEGVIIKFRDKNVVIARFRDENEGLILVIYIYVYIF